MRPTFFGLEIAKTGLFISQKQLDITGHNLANVETEGYSRQRLETANINPAIGIRLIMDMERGRVGGGVEALTTKQIRDYLLDLEYRTEVAKMRNFEVKADTLSFLDKQIGELSEQSLTYEMEQFVAAINNLARDPEDQELRTLLRTSGTTLSTMFNNFYKMLKTEQDNQNTQAGIVVSDVNYILESIAQLNDAIFSYEMSGEYANDLRDHRNLLFDALAAYGNVTTNETSGKMSVTFAGVEVVNHKQFGSVQLTTDSSMPPDQPYRDHQLYACAVGGDPTDPLDLTLIYDSSNPASSQLTHGELRARMDLRDGNDPKNAGIQYYIDKLNEFATDLITAVNGIHKDGWSMPYTDAQGVDHLSEQNIHFFECDPNNPAGTMDISAKIKESVFLIAASTIEVVKGGSTTGDENLLVGNNEAMLNLASVLDKNALGEQWRSIVIELGENARNAAQMFKTRGTLVHSIHQQRLSVMGVSLDEEMANLIRFNHAYSASSRVITTLDEALDKLINGTGRCGL